MNIPVNKLISILMNQLPNPERYLEEKGREYKIPHWYKPIGQLMSMPKKLCYLNFSIIENESGKIEWVFTGMES